MTKLDNIFQKITQQGNLADLKQKVLPRKILDRAKNRFFSKPCRVRPLVNMIKVFKSPINPEKWVFIIGCYNSGTTLLESLIATHPTVSALDEGVFKTDELVTPEELGWTRMWCQVVDQIRLEAGDKSVNVDELKRDWALFFDPRKPVFLEKSIANSARMTWLQQNFEDPYFIFIVRNGYAVAEGIRRKAPQGRQKPPDRFGRTYPIELCAKQWVVNNQIVESDSKKITNFTRICYEKLCENPKDVVKEIWDFLGLRGEVDWPGGKKWRIQEKYSIIKNMNTRSFENLSPDDIEKIEMVAGEMLNFYGYPLLSGKS